MEAAEQFRDTWIEVTGTYDFRLEEVKKELSPESQADLPKAAREELTALVEDCIEDIERLETRMAEVFAKFYILEELVELRNLLETEAGRRALEDDKPLDETSFLKTARTPSEKERIQKAISSGLLAKYKSHFWDVFTSINELADPLIKKRDVDFPNAVFELKESYKPDLVFSAPFETADSKSLLRFYTEPMACVSDYLEAEGISVGRFELEEGTEKRYGDCATALLSFGNEGLDTQWLIRIEIVEKTAAEKARSAEETKSIRYTSLGSRFEYDSMVNAFAVQMVGPFTQKDNGRNEFEPKVSEFRLLLKGDLLELGLQDAAAFLSRYHTYTRDLNLTGNETLSGSSQPYSEERTASTKMRLKGLNVALEEERAFAGSIVALWEFLQVVVRTPQLRTIFLKVAKVSPITYLQFRKNGTTIRYQSADFQRNGALDELGELPIYTFPITIEVKSNPIVLVRLIVTRPDPPLFTTAGIVGFVAVSPVDAQKRVVMRLLSAERE